MQRNYPLEVNVTFNGVQLGTTGGNSSEELNVCYTYPGENYTTPCAPGGMGYNDNHEPGPGNGTEWVNDHCVRVTSDYLMWYDVTDLVQPESNVWVKSWNIYFDGRIVVVTLVVAYNDGDSDTIRYWVNQGHDVDNYYWDDQGGPNYIGETNFTVDLPIGSTIENVNLTVVHKASTDGAYTFNGISIPTDPDSTTTPPGENWQGAYSGYNIWYATELFNSTGNNTLTYDRIAGFYKIVLAFLSVKTVTEPVEKPDLDTGSPANPYPSIFGMHNGTITVNQNITVNSMYTYACSGTGGHTEFVKIWNETTGDCAEAHWDGYIGDYHNIQFNKTLILKKGMIYNYTIRTGSYPQIHHRGELEAVGGTGTIRCTKFVDANGKEYNNWIPAIKLY
jgi:hypothetical protein